MVQGQGLVNESMLTGEAKPVNKEVSSKVYGGTMLLKGVFLVKVDRMAELSAINQIMKLRGNSEFGDNSLRPRITPKLNLSATSLTKLITWKPGQVQEPSSPAAWIYRASRKCLTALPASPAIPSQQKGAFHVFIPSILSQVYEDGE